MHKDCKLWDKNVDRDGYGNIKRQGKQWKAHRWVWTQTFGEIPAGMLVLHKCDVPGCVNPEHLFLGTQLDNARDAMEKGRHSKGEKIGNSKLTENDVRFIRFTKIKHDIICNSYGISKASVGKIKSKVNWAHVT